MEIQEHKGAGDNILGDKITHFVANSVIKGFDQSGKLFTFSSLLAHYSENTSH